MSTIQIRKAVVHITLPLSCCHCGQVGVSEPIKFEVEFTTPNGLDDAIRKQRIGTHFPVGWSSNMRHKDGKYLGVEYECPGCVKRLYGIEPR